MDDVAGAAGPPLHVFRTRVWFDELDKVGVLHNARYAVHAERALTSWFETRPELDRGPDARQLVKGYEIEFRRPISAPGELDVELRVAKLGTTSCAYEFRFVGDAAADSVRDSAADSEGDALRPVYAVGKRTVVKVTTGEDGVMRPAPWTEVFRQAHGQ